MSEKEAGLSFNAKMAILAGAMISAMATIAFSACIGGFFLWLIWPYAAVEVFHLPPLTLWQAITLTWVCNILFHTKVKVEKD